MTKLPLLETDASRALRLRVRGALFEPEPRIASAIRCTACAHRCVLEEGRTGACGVRVNEGSAIEVPFGWIARKYVRPIETNTLYHVRPGALALTFGMLGCDLRCPYCHNAQLSQPLRDPEAGDPGAITEITPEALVDEAIASGAEAICAAYNEPMITAEWAHAIFAAAKARGLVTALITDGHSTPEALAYMRPVTDVFRVDLKGANQDQYRTLGGRHDAVVTSLREAHALGYWIEVVTLVVPGFNDTPTDLASIATTIAEIDPGIPWHLDAFQPRYRMRDRRPPSPMGLALAAGAAYARGLRFVYVGNVGDALPDLSATRCPGCHSTLVERRDWSCTTRRLDDLGGCPSCGLVLPGIFAPGETARTQAQAQAQA
jgi:pyruvate formate lyase activating enzyme